MIIQGSTGAQKIHTQVGVCHEILKIFRFISVALQTLFDLRMLAWNLGAQKVHKNVVPVLGHPYAAKQVPHVVIRSPETITVHAGQLL